MTFRSAYTRAPGIPEIAAELVAQLDGETAPAVVMFFSAHPHDGAKLSGTLREQWPDAQVIGCTTAGEFTETATGTGGVSAIAIPQEAVGRAHAELAGFRQGVTSGIEAAGRRLAANLGSDLRDLDPQRWIGFVLIDGLHAAEEEANVALGGLNPFLSFVGGSAGDDLEFRSTRVFCNGKETDHGAVLLLIESTGPFTVVKTCSFTARPEVLRITRADPARRIVHEIDGRPAVEVYAEAVGVRPDQVDSSVFMRHPFGLMVEGEPWIRSPREVLPDGSLLFYCLVSEDTGVHLMDGGDLIGETRTALASASDRVGGTAGAVLFNCILRRLQMDSEDLHEAWLDTLGDVPTAGFHTYGESWLGHINQTCTGVVFHRPTAQD